MNDHAHPTCPLCGAPTKPEREPLSAAAAKAVLDNPATVVEHALLETKIPKHFLRNAGDEVFSATAQIVVAYVQSTKMTSVQDICELVRKTFLVLAEPVR